MFLQQLPEFLRWILLFLIGAGVGSLVNVAIYRLAIRKRPISPWSPSPDPQQPRSWADRVPVVGWWCLRRETSHFGRGHWIRPLLIEVALGIGLVWFYQWTVAGNLYGGETVVLIPAQREMVGVWNFSWFMFFSVLFALMTAATFIDFDEQIIPDGITIPGTVFALVSLAIAPSLRLPYTQPEQLSTRLIPLNFWTPDPAVAWHQTWLGPLVAMIIVVVWTFALMPKWATLRFGWRKGLWLMFASLLRPPRKKSGKVPRQVERRMFAITKGLAALAIGLVVFCLVVFFLGGTRWTALMDSLLGIAMGGGIVWAVRVIAGQALGVEAMGFGDVTLMSMIGAFVGWQPALLAFAIAPFTSIVIALIQLITAGENRLAFGPYLCLGTAIVLIGWDWVWNDWAAEGVFALGGQFLVMVILVCLVLMALMLGTWAKFKYGHED